VHEESFHLHGEGRTSVHKRLDSTLDQLRAAHERFEVFGETGEFTLARLSGDFIEFLIRHRHDDLDNPEPVALGSGLAEPMRRALAGESGTVVGLDYRGVKVLAAHEPVLGPGLGIVAKIDVKEVRAPFLRAGLVSFAVLLLVVVGGVLLFARVRNPIMRRLESHSRDLEQEVEERARAEEGLRSSHRLLETVIEGTSDPVYLKDPDGRYRMINSAGASVMGRPAEEIVGRFDKELVPERIADAVVALDREVMSGSVARAVEEVGETAGERRFFLSSKTPLIGEDGSCVGLVGISRDITELKRAEQGRRELEVRLRQQQKLESIGTLAGGVAHEINNPIHGIMNYAQLIVDNTSADSSADGHAREIIVEAERVAAIVRNLLTFARHDKQSHSRARLADVIDGTLALVKTVLRRDQITLDVDVPDDLPAIKCRSQQIQQVLMNLVTNARDALNERYPEFDENKVILITGSVQERDGRRWLRTTVEDHGVGIPAEERGRIFDPFYTTKARDVGTGLGLSISHGIVSEHHGELSIESEPRHYTKIHMDLPVDDGWSLRTGDCSVLPDVSTGTQ